MSKNFEVFSFLNRMFKFNFNLEYYVDTDNMYCLFLFIRMDIFLYLRLVASLLPSRA